MTDFQKRGVQILVVDNDATAAASQVGWLRTEGYDASAAIGFQAASRRLEERPPHLLIAPLRLGAFNGVHLVFRGRAYKPEVLALIVGDVVDEGREEAHQSGASFARKPQNRDELLRLVRDMLVPRKED
jgi:DNA-binding response OmpR family regulator